MDKKEILFTLILTIISLFIGLFVAEGALRLKNTDGKNYHIEMWKYSKRLKHASDNPILGHEHTPGKEARLQNVIIRINKDGMRGADLPPIQDKPQDRQRQIMVLGSSATLGWGIEEEETLSSQLQQKFKQNGQDAIVMNAGIGNYNAQRYVELFLSKNTGLEPTDIVVNYYLNDAEILKSGGGNVFLRHSQLAVTAWLLWNRFKVQNQPAHLRDHYKETYEPGHAGFQAMKTSLKKLSQYAQENKISLTLLMMPEVHDLQDYRYGFAHDIMKEIAAQNGYHFVDALPAFQESEDSQEFWAMPGDPHPNAKAHKIFADILYPALMQ